VIWLLWALALLIILPVALLIPRVRFSGSASPGEFSLMLRGIGFRIHYDLGQGFGGRFLFFRFKETPKDSASEPVQSKPRISFSRPKPSLEPQAEGSKTASTSKTKIDITVERKPLDRGLALLLIKRLLKLVWRLLKGVRTDYIRATVTVATPDPMWTGIVFGALQPMMIWNAPPKRGFNLLINFKRESPVIEAEWSFSARPIRIIGILLVWGAGLPWKRLWALRKRRKKKEERGKGKETQ